MGKNIVVLCDGTWENKCFRTNVYVLSKLLPCLKGRQHVKYFNGIGVGEDPVNFIIDGAIAKNLKNKIKEAYNYIVSNYEPGDDIWLFGFSRGAYTVRSIAEMIQHCGILKDSNKFEDAYKFYRNNNKNNRNKNESVDFNKDKYSHPNTGPTKKVIKFLGLWDTVGAKGLPRFHVLGDDHFNYLELINLEVPNVVNFACQALAIHERVSFFKPCHILPNGHNKKDVIETWFPGVHLEIGGGNFYSFEVNENISKATMLWMINHIKNAKGLQFDCKIKAELHLDSNFPNKRFSKNVKHLIFDRSSSIIPTLMLKDRVIPCVKDEYSGNGKYLKKDLLYNNGDWLNQFGSRSHLSIQYASKAYENLRMQMNKEGIKLYGGNIIYESCRILRHKLRLR
ncbi:hypothetical protein RclHR1_01050012 [Rhizophagus clarus]|uniref:DUF2235 domain-containing protein n=1 Tax=Rhizophagus clarus TaxID=94130 RepID=A0A2Z6QSZ1_9GLOM|nr:hypothetical protein RclHR1_01050012 [Rhizophagus clarus]GES73900.1 DUF2235 domain-containing protein [Rhizophagus clarus]